MGAFIDLTGQRFGRLVVVRREGAYAHDNRTNAKWLCRCDCGAEKVVIGMNLRSGNTKSCGCLAIENRRDNMRSIWAAWKEAKHNDHDTAATPEAGA